MKLFTDPQYRAIEIFLHSVLGAQAQRIKSKKMKRETEKILDTFYKAETLTFEVTGK